MWFVLQYVVHADFTLNTMPLNTPQILFVLVTYMSQRDQYVLFKHSKDWPPGSGYKCVKYPKL